MEKRGSIERRAADTLVDPFSSLTLDEKRNLVLQLAPQVLTQLPEEEQGEFLQELQENLTLGRATASSKAGGDSNPDAWEVPSGQ